MNNEKLHIIRMSIALVLLIGLTGAFQHAAAQALDFDGVNDNATASSVMTQTDNFTLEAWVKPSEASGYNWIVCLDITSVAIGTYSGNLTYLVNGGTGGGISAQALTLNQWCHVALVRRNGTYELYYNGTNVTPTTYSISPSISSGNLSISRSSGEIWQGGIDEVRIWSVARTATEITNNYLSELSNPTSQTGLKAYYKMNEGVPGQTNTSITTLIEASGNNHPAALTGFAMTGATSNYISQFGTSCTNPTNGGTISATQTICAGLSPSSFTETAAPAGTIVGTLQYQWQSSTTSSTASFADITDATNATYSPGTLTQTTWFKRLVKVSCETNWVESNVVEITVNPLLQYRSKQTGSWTTTANWEQYNGSVWVAATSYPGQITNSCASPLVTVQIGHVMEIPIASHITIPNLKFEGTGKTIVRNTASLQITTNLQMAQNAVGAIVKE